MDSKPIGVFDSGYGGLTILKELVTELPEYDYLYLGDNARAPYGTRSFETVYNYTLDAVKWFFEQGCHLVILACNTASAKALRTIQQNDLEKLAPGKRVLGVIRPTTEVLGNYSQTKSIGVLGTKGTVASNSYIIEVQKFFPGVNVHQEACPIWVPLIENYLHNTEAADPFVQMHINNLLQKSRDIDTILLACTHYPLMFDKVRKATPDSITLVTQGEIVASSLREYLRRHPEIECECSKQGIISFFTTDSTEEFNQQSMLFFGKEINSKQAKL
jgi:glutamate racemase